jgi:lysophospholipase L1-like esterase
MTVDSSSLTWRQWCSLTLAAYLGLLCALAFLKRKRTKTFEQNKAPESAEPQEPQKPLEPAESAEPAESTDSIDQPLDRFADDILAFERDDKDNPPPEGETVFIGSSTFALAAQMLSEYFANFHPIVRAFGGSTIPEINHYIEQTVLKYKPAKICFYAGTNDIADGHSGERVFRDFRAFAARVHARLPHTEIIFISMSMAPSRVQWGEQYSSGNSLVRELAKQSTYLRYVDVTHVMYDTQGNLHQDWFLEDQLHMNHLGYDAWFPIIRDALDGKSA